MNRLQHETSPYLLQHADNPVDWYPWGDEAFARAQTDDKPILLSVGYSACHWCHVMAHESFEDAPTAEVMNRLFVNVKVDREERPDVDDIYMSVVQAMTRSGGWPMTVFLTPTGKPFYGGTYFPKVAYGGMPSFTQILEGVADAYQNRRADVEQQAAALTDALSRDILSIGGTHDALSTELLDVAGRALLAGVDRQHGGFGGAPKFPQPMALAFLLRHAARTGDTTALNAVSFTLTRMARGGIYDHVGGGFHRYAVDAIWLVPHFEKMLYDNAQLARVYALAYQMTANPFFRHVTVDVCDYLMREMAAPDGGFYSTTDADSIGADGHAEEGRFFVWTQHELEALLGDDAPLAIELLGVSARGNFEGANVLHVPNDEAVVAQRLSVDLAEVPARVARIKDVLYAARAQRVPPALDDKIITAWNGLAIAAMVQTGRALGHQPYLDAATRAATFVRGALTTADGRLLRTVKDGVAKGQGYLEDYAYLADGLLVLYEATHDDQWFTWARALADVALAHFGAPDGGFYDTADDHEALIVRPRNLQDNATPAASNRLCRVLVRLHALTGDGRYIEAARNALRLLSEAMRQYPLAFGEALCALDALVQGVTEVAIVGDPTDARTIALRDVVVRAYRPNTVLVLVPHDVPGNEHPVALLHGRTQQGGVPTAYVCRHFACQLPVTTPEALAAQLDAGGPGAVRAHAEQ